MKCTTLYRQGDHRWLAFTSDGSDRRGKVIDTNQYVVASGKVAMILDPGGMEVFPEVMGGLTQEIEMDEVRHLFMSHQDPDVGSSLALWRRVCPADTQIHVPSLWTGFFAHYDAEARLTGIPDEGGRLRMGDIDLQFVPAHYLHSSANLNLYDPAARILFSGDIGAAILPDQARGSVFVTNFADHIAYMDGFHRRWMGSPTARDAWVSMVSRLDVHILAPQHGLMMKGDDVKRFLDWFARLEVGNGIGAMRGK